MIKRAKFAEGVLIAAPFVILTGYGIYKILRDQAPGWVQSWIDFTFENLLLGIFVSIVFWSILEIIRDRVEKFDRTLIERLKNALGKIPAPHAMHLLVDGDEQLPTFLLEYLFREKCIQDAGFTSIVERGVWNLTTARLYEAIVTTIPNAGEIEMIDQDIRRWVELLKDSSTSTTFNYSVTILDVLFDAIVKAEGRKLTRFRRIFVVDPAQVHCFNHEDRQIARGHKTWSKLQDATRILILIWAFERRVQEILKKRGLNYSPIEFETRVLIIDNSVREATKIGLRANYDSVVLDTDFSFVENIDYHVQSSKTTSNLTHSWIAVESRRHKNVSPKRKLFKELWDDKAIVKGLDDFPDFICFLESPEVKEKLAGFTH
jgi:hypothetical protein